MDKTTKMQKEAKKPVWQLALVFSCSFAMLFIVLVFAIVGGYREPFTANPLNETKSLLSDLVVSPGALRQTPEVVFKPDDVLATSAIVERLPMSKDQLCMSTGQFEQDKENGFECLGCEDAVEIQRLVYRGKNNQTARIAIVCDVGLSELKADIETYGLDGLGGTSITDACAVCEGKGKCCAIVLKRP